jgi:hypothetical protein
MATVDFSTIAIQPLNRDDVAEMIFRNARNTRQLDSLYDLIEGTLNDLDTGFEYADDYAMGICHTLRLLGMFDQADINRWSETPIRIARREMLQVALKVVGQVA